MFSTTGVTPLTGITLYVSYSVFIKGSPANSIMLLSTDSGSTYPLSIPLDGFEGPGPFYLLKDVKSIALPASSVLNNVKIKIQFTGQKTTHNQLYIYDIYLQ